MNKLPISIFTFVVALIFAAASISAQEKPAKEKKSAPAKSGAKKEAEPEKEAQPGPKVLPENPFPKRFPAPSLDGGTEWLNTSGEITLKDLRGKIVLLDFWTYCCINCMHVLPDLKFLEEKYAKQIVVIGVHSAKFDNEKESDAIRKAIMRYEIVHPVINDSQMTVWQKFDVHAWPTFVLIDPEGQVCGYTSSEGQRELLDLVIGKVVDYHRAKGTLDESPVKFVLERDRVTEPTPLRFPGKLLVDEEHDRLFISDSNHNRIVVTTLAGKLVDVIGSGAIGKADGGFSTATFDHPQGIELVGDNLYVADTENHLIRRVDLGKKVVATAAGTGEQDRVRAGGGKALSVSLNSPWDLVHVNGVLYIAMAGPHQIWTLDLPTNELKVYAGSGREDILDDDLRRAALAQPSGITTDGKFLYWVDSEGSSVRKAPLGGKGEVETIVGTSNLPRGRCLFEFGDKDGVGDAARLQHPLGIAYHAGSLFVADSYNHKIKQVSLDKKESKTFLGDREAGDRDDPPRFSEPAGLAFAPKANKLYVADTNNHLIRVVDLKSGKVSKLALDGVTPPKPPKSSTADDAGKNVVKVDPQRIAAGDTLSFEIALNLPDGFKLNKLAPVSYQLAAVGSQDVIDPKHLDARKKIDVDGDGTSITVPIPMAKASGKTDLKLTLTFSYCREGTGGLCKVQTSAWSIPIEIDAQAKDRSVRLTATAK
ncbi:MAG: redoxin domain-containing protein [Planctomycetales bacterium]|nr:redoxin domain-containing protein [Planctomycetales bacterium]